MRTVRNEKVNWWPGKILKVVSIVTFLVRVGSVVRFCHADHLRCKVEPSRATWSDLLLPAEEEETNKKTWVVKILRTKGGKMIRFLLNSQKDPLPYGDPLEQSKSLRDMVILDILRPAVYVICVLPPK